MDPIVHVTVCSGGQTLGYCRANIRKCSNWSQLMEDVAQKCALPVSLLNTGQRSVNGLPVRALNLLRHGEQLVVTIEAPPDFDPDAASSALAQEEAMLQEELSALEAARRKEMAVKEAEDAAFAQRLAEEEDAERAKGRLFECPVCRDECPIDGCVTLNCNHRYCADCFAGYVESKISEKAVTLKLLKCAIPDCGAPITPHEVAGHVSAAVNLKYLTFAAEVSIEADPNHVRCPRCGLLTIFPPRRKHEDFWRQGKCPNHNCNHRFCAICKDDAHDSTCEAYAKWKVENGKVDETFAKLMREQQWSKCPHCGMPVILEEGCFFMTCKPPCSRHFCYLCGVALTKDEHYSHFPAGPYKRECKSGGAPLATRK